MPRKGYDDEPHIRRVVELMESDPGLSRHAAIKAVVGINPSNVRRIEQKMTRATLAPAAQPILMRSTPPKSDHGSRPDAVGEPATNHRTTDAVHASRKRSGRTTELGFAVAGVAAVTGLIAIYYLAGFGIAHLGSGIYRAELNLAGVLGLPTGIHVLSSIDGSAWSSHETTTLDEHLTLRAVAANAILPVTILLHLILCAMVLLYARTPPRAHWSKVLKLPVVLGALALISYLVPSLSDMALAGSALLTWQSLRDDDGGTPLRLPPIVETPASERKLGIFFLGVSGATIEA